MAQIADGGRNLEAALGLGRCPHQSERSRDGSWLLDFETFAAAGTRASGVGAGAGFSISRLFLQRLQAAAEVRNCTSLQ